jgi:hypothetical protein
MPAGVALTIAASLVACETDAPALQESFVSAGEIVLYRFSVASETEVAVILEELFELPKCPGEPGRE